MHFSRAVRSAVAAGVALAVSAAVSAQSTTIDFVNSELDPIPLLDGSAVTIDGNGNIQANCVLEGSSCQGVTSGNTPGVTLSATGGNTQTITGSGSVALSWSSSNAAEVCMARSTNGYAGWSGLKAATGSQTVSFNATGSYALSLECYNDNGSGTSGAVNVTVEEGQGPVDGCNITSSDPLFQPANFTQNIKTWEQAFYGQSFPDIDNGGLSPVGSVTIGNAPIAGDYISIPFVPGSSENHKLEWYSAQAVLDRNYRNARAAEAVYVTISPCAGDFRLYDSAAPKENTLSRYCRLLGKSGVSISYGTTGASSFQCTLTPGNTYYVNILFADPRDGLTPTENSCMGGSAYCEANFGGY